MDESWFSLILLWNWFRPIHVIIDYGLWLSSCHEDNGYGFPIGILWWMIMDYDQVASFLRHQEECVIHWSSLWDFKWRVYGSVFGPRLVRCLETMQGGPLAASGTASRNNHGTGHVAASYAPRSVAKFALWSPCCSFKARNYLVLKFHPHVIQFGRKLRTRPQVFLGKVSWHRALMRWTAKWSCE